MHSKATMVGKGTWNHTKSHRSEADSFPVPETDVISQANPPVTHLERSGKPRESLTAQGPSPTQQAPG